MASSSSRGEMEKMGIDQLKALKEQADLEVDLLQDSLMVLIDIGTGYFIEKTMGDGKNYCQRKIDLLKSNLDQLFEVAAKKKSVADEAGMVLQAKIKQLTAATTS